MKIDRAEAEKFNAKQFTEGKLTIRDFTDLVAYFQAERGLVVDGKAGDQETIPAIRAEFQDDPIAQIPVERAWPLRALPDGRKPAITSGFYTRNPDRPNHVGVDLFYPYIAGKDPALKVGDGGRTSKWWIPNNHHAIACADGKITGATWTQTGYHVRIAFKRAETAVGYFHLSSMLVAVGQEVTMGQPIGIVGDNPVDNDARHLHFELYMGTTGWKRLDPEMFLESARVLV